MTEKSGCLICGKDLVYAKENKTLSCYLCHKKIETNVSCQDEHYICDSCHSSDGLQVIKTFCQTTDLTDPLEIAIKIMAAPQIKMHGPEHHFLVPGVLLTAYYNFKQKKDKIKEKLAQAEKRSSLILGGFCGSHGVCGAAVGTGIFISLITEATPLSKKEWTWSNLITSQALTSIASQGGPRCCKRNCFLAIIEARKSLKENMKISFPEPKELKCNFFPLNKECQQTRCPFFGGKKK